ncbi:tRNA uridine-5-carboxymethylaminomethyl(34) synthesis GTPase MnmE [Solitalea canadensis]|uniref:tRNA modification GTPase MnmE n=1 Tax=Solitalea canadensis (strain ATCC 29591 / DSM 3403 / JCM 21819 / LMG 8368 / NBRC 15130 / NCIMB 12057 / USAM 9D) TaxID=929556 RepID=H8KU51_SOLCM|nr:tRNA uridine-5-carboxymethylaminomethyl(34) synthesis GTPase MnmE [Solitalea canadensis]AFD07031.1 tRNA modification GTPase TrmE [Solitalea canadensis DSM 3403]
MFSNSPFAEDTIVALATPSGTGAIAVIRLSGPEAISICNKVFHGKDLEKQPSHTVHFGTIREDGIIIDEVLATVFVAPSSYTRENSVEVSCHASPYIIQKLINLFIKNGARIAKPGEFTLRAFLNGQLDLSQAEAVADLIASRTEASHNMALRQLRGGFSNELKALRQQLIDFAALIELELDFAEEDVEFANRPQLKALISSIQSVIRKLIKSFDLGNAIKNGIPVVISGKPNVGKSTLLNALLNEERAIVSEIAGTTRDTIEDEINIGGINFRFIDTAGIRETSDKIESIGVEKAYEKIRQSALVIYLFDPEETSADELRAIVEELGQHTSIDSILLVANKLDRTSETELQKQYAGLNGMLFISAKDRINLDKFTEALLHKAHVDQLNNDETMISNVRHLEALQKTNEALDDTLRLMDQPFGGELLAFEIKRALHHLGEITGDISNEDLLDSIFTRFCIGK